MGSGSGLWELEISNERRIVPVKEEDESLVDGRDCRRVRLVVGAKEAVDKTGDDDDWELGAGLIRDGWKDPSLIDGARGGRPPLDPGLGMYAVQLRLLERVSVPLEAMVVGGKDKKGDVPG